MKLFKISSHQKRRLIEIAPGIVGWTLITLPIWGGLLIPRITAYILLLIYIYFFYKSLAYNFFFWVAYFRIRRAISINWKDKLTELDDIKGSIESLQASQDDLGRTTQEEFAKGSGITNKLKSNKIVRSVYSQYNYRILRRSIQSEIERLEELQESQSKDQILDWHKIKNVVVMPFYKEGYGVMKLSMDYLKAQTFPTKQMVIVLATELKHPDGYEIARKLKAEYQEYFYDIWPMQHELVPGESAGKHSNMNSASKKALEKIRELGWDEKYITWTGMDCDSHFNREYFSAMTYHFVTDQNRYINLYSAPMQFTANYHRLYFYGRANAISNSFAGIANSAREHHHIPISTYTASLELHKDMDFWDVDVIPEDAHNFFKALFLEGDEMRAITIYLPTQADTAEGLTHRSAFINQYEQEKRWAYGASHHYKLLKMLKDNFTWYKSLRLFNYLHFHYTWGWLGFVLFFGSSLALMVNKDFSYTILGSNMSRISSQLLTSIIFLFIISILMLLSLIQNNGKKSFLRKVIELVELIFLPVIRIFTSFAGLDAHTRLMLAKYMEYRVTEKIS